MRPLSTPSNTETDVNANDDYERLRSYVNPYDTVGHNPIDTSRYAGDSSFSKAFDRGTDQFQATLYGFTKAVGDTLGVDMISRFGAEGIERNIKEMLANPAEIRDWDDVNSLAEFGTYFIEALGEQAPQLLADIPLLAVSAAASSTGVGAGGAASALATRAAIGKAIKRKLGERAFINFKRGLKIAPVASLVAQGVGETKMEMDSAGAGDHDTLIWGTGVAKAMLDKIGLETIVGKALKVGVDPTDLAKAAGEVAKAALVGTGAEATTEFAQTVLDKTAVGIATGDDIFSAENLKEMREAAIKGGLIGGTMSGGMNMAASYTAYADGKKQALLDQTEELLRDENFTPVDDMVEPTSGEGFTMEDAPWEAPTGFGPPAEDKDKDEEEQAKLGWNPEPTDDQIIYANLHGLDAEDIARNTVPVPLKVAPETQAPGNTEQVSGLTSIGKDNWIDDLEMGTDTEDAGFQVSENPQPREQVALAVNEKAKAFADEKGVDYEDFAEAFDSVFGALPEKVSTQISELIAHPGHTKETDAVLAQLFDATLTKVSKPKRRKDRKLSDTADTRHLEEVGSPSQNMVDQESLEEDYLDGVTSNSGTQLDQETQDEMSVELEDEARDYLNSLGTTSADAIASDTMIDADTARRSKHSDYRETPAMDDENKPLRYRNELDASKKLAELFEAEGYEADQDTVSQKKGDPKAPYFVQKEWVREDVNSNKKYPRYQIVKRNFGKPYQDKSPDQYFDDVMETAKRNGDNRYHGSQNRSKYVSDDERADFQNSFITLMNRETGEATRFSTMDLATGGMNLLAASQVQGMDADQFRVAGFAHSLSRLIDAGYSIQADILSGDNSRTESPFRTKKIRSKDGKSVRTEFEINPNLILDHGILSRRRAAERSKETGAAEQQVRTRVRDVVFTPEKTRKIRAEIIKAKRDKDYKKVRQLEEKLATNVKISDELEKLSNLEAKSEAAMERGRVDVAQKAQKEAAGIKQRKKSNPLYDTDDFDPADASPDKGPSKYTRSKEDKDGNVTTKTVHSYNDTGTAGAEDPGNTVREVEGGDVDNAGTYKDDQRSTPDTDFPGFDRVEHKEVGGHSKDLDDLAAAEADVRGLQAEQSKTTVSKTTEELTEAQAHNTEVERMEAEKERLENEIKAEKDKETPATIKKDFARKRANLRRKLTATKKKIAKEEDPDTLAELKATQRKLERRLIEIEHQHEGAKVGKVKNVPTALQEMLETRLAALNKRMKKFGGKKDLAPLLKAIADENAPLVHAISVRNRLREKVANNKQTDGKKTAQPEVRGFAGRFGQATLKFIDKIMSEIGLNMRITIVDPRDLETLANKGFVSLQEANALAREFSDGRLTKSGPKAAFISNGREGFIVIPALPKNASNKDKAFQLWHIAHELGHGVLNSSMDNFSPAQAKALEEAFSQDRAKSVQYDGPNGFAEWFSDQIAARAFALANKSIRKNERNTPINIMYDEVIASLDKLMRAFTKGMAAMSPRFKLNKDFNDLINDMKKDGVFKKATSFGFGPREYYTDAEIGAARAQLTAAKKNIIKWAKIIWEHPFVRYPVNFVIPADTQLRLSYGKTGEHIANMIYWPFNTKRKGKTPWLSVHDDASKRYIGNFFNDLGIKNMKTTRFSENDLRDAFDQLSQERPDSELNEPAMIIRKFLEKYHEEFLSRAMPTVGRLDRYFPRQYVQEAVDSRRAEFNTIMRRHGLDGDHVAESLFESDVGVDAFSASMAPSGKHSKTRKLNDHDLVRDLSEAGFINTNPVETMMAYLHNTLQEGTYHHRFGGYRFLPGARKNSTIARMTDPNEIMAAERQRDERIQEFLEMNNLESIEQAVDYNFVSYDDEGNIQIYDKSMKLNLAIARGVRNKDITPAQAARIRKVVSGIQGKNGVDMNPQWRHAQSNAMMITNWLTLFMSPISGIIEVAMIYKSVKDVESFRIATRGIIASIKNREELIEVYGQMGMVEHTLHAHILSAMYGYQNATSFAQKGNELLFKINGQSWLTTTTRLAAAETGKEFLKHHARKAAEGNQRSVRYLEEMGITDHRVVSEWIEQGQPLWNMEENNRVARVMQSAIARFVQSSVLTPNRAERPDVMNDPRWGLVWHLKSFAYTFNMNVVQGTFTEMAARRDEANSKTEVVTENAKFLLPMIGVFMGIAMIVNELREELQYAMGGEYRPSDKMDTAKYIKHLLVNRIGAGAIPETYLNAVNNTYRNTLGVFALSPTVGKIDQLLNSRNNLEMVMNSTPVLAQNPGAKKALRNLYKDLGEDDN